MARGVQKKKQKGNGLFAGALKAGTLAGTRCVASMGVFIAMPARKKIQNSKIRMQNDKKIQNLRVSFNEEWESDFGF